MPTPVLPQFDTAPAGQSLTARQTAAAVIVPLVFTVIYGGTAWITSHRADWGSLHFSWERHIPFVPAMIIPYLCLDFLFLVAIFLCTSAQELARFARSSVICIAIAGLCFVLFPLSFGFPRPEVQGVFRLPYRILWTIDCCGNLCPSLHAALTLLVWPICSRHAPHRLRPLIHGWFGLILLSPLLTYQHHVPDILAGLGLAMACQLMGRSIR